MVVFLFAAGLGGAARWKAGLLDKAAAVFSTRRVDLQSHVYGAQAVATAGVSGRQEVRFKKKHQNHALGSLTGLLGPEKGALKQHDLLSDHLLNIVWDLATSLRSRA